MRSVSQLQEACAGIIADPKLQPIKDAKGRIVETHCNFGAIRVANAMGCKELDGLMADQQYAVMEANKSGFWLKCSDVTASLHARKGGLAFAAMTGKQLGEAHGHIAALTPEPMQFSGSLNKYVPMVANIGKTDADEKESQAFPVAKGEPDYFCWLG